MSEQSVVPPLKPRVRKRSAERAAWKAQGQASVDGIRAMVARAMRAAGDPLLGTTIGRMKVDGVITGQQYAAAEAYGRLRGRFDREMGTMRRSARSPCYGAAHGGGMAA